MIKAALFAWGIPVVIVVTVRMLSPDPGLSEDDYPSTVFVPSEVEILEKQGRKRSDFFEVRLHHPDGATYFHRAPDPEPINELYHRIPRDVPLKITYSQTERGNVLMGIALANRPAEPILSFEEIMAEYASRRRLVYIVAGIWFALGNLLLIGLWREKKSRPATKEPPEDLAGKQA